jgi:hypothetical protein
MVRITGKGLRGTPPQYLAMQVLSSNQQLSRRAVTQKRSSLVGKTVELERFGVISELPAYPILHPFSTKSLSRGVRK